MHASLNSVIFGSGNGLAPNKLQAIIRTKADLLSVRQSGSWFNEIWLKNKRVFNKGFQCTWTCRLKNNINFVQNSLLMTYSCAISHMLSIFPTQRGQHCFEQWFDGDWVTSHYLRWWEQNWPDTMYAIVTIYMQMGPLAADWWKEYWDFPFI